MSTEAGTHIEVTSGVSVFTVEGFCAIVIRAGGCDGQLLGAGQDTPAGIRSMALDWLAAAEAAESDAAVFGQLTEDGLSPQAAGQFIALLRSRRDARRSRRDAR